MKKLYAMILLAVVLFAACTHENDPVVKQIVTIQASIANDSRVALGDGENEKKVSWTEGDKITLRIHEVECEFTWQEGTTFAYSGKGELPQLKRGLPLYAIYASTFGPTQTGEKDDVGKYMELRAYPNSESRKYEDLNIIFEHGTSVLKLTLSNDDFKSQEVKDIIVKAGTTVVAAATATFTGDAENGSVTAYFAIQPGTLENVTIHATCNGNTYSSSLGNKTVVAGKLYTANVQEFLPNYLIFVAEAEGQSLKIRAGGGSGGAMLPGEGEEELNLQYSTDGTNWTDLEYYTQVDFVHRKLFLRGTAENGTNGAKISFGNDAKVACSGDIRTLMNYENYSDIQTSGNFQSLFQGCTSLTTAPTLPATTLASNCYKSMFSGCTSLTTAPELNATTLASRCYESMFSGCTSLTTAPALPATDLDEYCYAFMFKGCTELTTAPALNATTLAANCYAHMFNGCSKLTDAPALPAENLDYMCYESMFSGCTSLTTAPALPATTLTPQCYDSMFKGCTLLTTAPELNATILAEWCYFGMFSDCTSLITAPELPATTLAGECYASMFSGCTSLNAAPELSATNLEGNCYKSMFSGCTSLNAAPALNATTLANYCYYDMFSGCTNLSSVTMLATDISAENCLKNWLSGVASSGTFTKAADMTALPEGASGIPIGWTVVDQ